MTKVEKQPRKHSDETKKKIRAGVRRKVAELRKEGKQIGRSKGSVIFDLLDRQQDYIFELHETLSLQQIVDQLKLIGIEVSKPTIFRYIKSRSEDIKATVA